MKFNIFHHQHSHGDSPHSAATKTSPQDVVSRSREGSAATPIKSADSDAIRNKVDVVYKQYNEFHINLKNLLKLYKEEHYALKTVNEKRFETAKTLDHMFCTSPIGSAVAQGSPSAPEPTQFFRDSLMDTVGREDGNMKTDGVSTRDSSGGNNPFNESESVKEEEVKCDPIDVRQSIGEEQSISLQTVDHPSPTSGPLKDPPADVEIPEDYSKDDTTRKSIGDSSLKAVSDDKDDAPTDEDTAHNVSLKSTESMRQGLDREDSATDVEHDPLGEKAELPPSETFCDLNESASGEPIGESAPTTDSVSFTESKGAELKADDTEDAVIEEKGKDEEDNEAAEDEVEHVVEPDIVVETNDPVSSEKESSLAVSSPSLEEDYFNSVSSPTLWSGTTKQSYYDVQELAHSQTTEYLEQHESLVKYVEDWERVLFQRVHGLYTEYMKERKSLEHYIKKLTSLRKEMVKLEKQSEEKEKPINPKKIEKLDRNELKLVEARDAHDKSGESLYLYLDEVVHRSWRDVFPLLNRTIKFDKDFAAMQSNVFLRLKGTEQLLDLVGKNKAISVASRLKSLKTLNPEVIYTGQT